MYPWAKRSKKQLGCFPEYLHATPQITDRAFPIKYTAKYPSEWPHKTDRRIVGRTAPRWEFFVNDYSLHLAIRGRADTLFYARIAALEYLSSKDYPGAEIALVAMRGR